MDGITAFLDSYGLAAIFGIMLVKSIGVPIPIPADAVMLAASAQAVQGRFVVWQAFVVLLVALLVGGLIQFAIVSGPGRAALYRYGRYLGITPARLDAAAGRLKKGGVIGMGIAILTPGVRSVAIPAAGIARLPVPQVASGLTLGSGTFLALHFFIGAVLASLLSSLGWAIPLSLLIGCIVVILAIGLGVWVLIRRRQMPDATQREILTQAYHAWHEATCPVCLALGTADRLQIHVHPAPHESHA